MLQLDPLMPNALSWRGRRYVDSGQLDPGEKMLQRSVDVGLAHAGFGLSRLAEVRGDSANARKYLLQQMEKHFFGEGADTAQGYVPPSS